MSELFADVNGIKICYEEKGKGEPALLVHGYTANKEGWIAQYIPLAEHFRVIRFDNRNGGNSERPNISNTLEMLADDVRGLMDFLKIDKAHIIGWSLGGIIVQKFTIKYPNRINKLVLINTVLGAPDEDSVELLKKNALKELEERKNDPVESFWKSAPIGYYVKFRKEMKENPKKIFYGLWSVEDLINIQNLNPLTPQDVINQSNALRDTITSDNLRRIKIPTLLIASSHDRLTSSKTMIEMHHLLPHSKLLIIEKAGHNSPISRAPEVNKNIIEFLKA